MTLVPAADGLGIATHDLGGQGDALVMVHAAGLHGLVLVPLAQVSFFTAGHGRSGG